MEEEKFNNIIDLMGDVFMARLVYKKLSNPRNSLALQMNIDRALTHCSEAVSMLYQGRKIPDVYTHTFHPYADRDVSHRPYYNQIYVMECYDLSSVVKRLNQNFVLSKKNDRQITKKNFFTGDETIDEPYKYTGRYVARDNNTYTPSPSLLPMSNFSVIKVEIVFKKSSYAELETSNFFMDVLSHSLTPASASILVLVGAWLIASDVEKNVGQCMIAAATILSLGRLAVSRGFFSDPSCEAPLSPSSQYVGC